MLGRRLWVSLVVLVVLPLGAAAQSRIVPEDPVEFERVHLRQTVDSCMFDESRVRVEMVGKTVVVTQPLNACLLPGPPEVVDIQLGAFPAGDYRVEVRLGEGQAPIERIEFEVQGLVVPAIFPPFPLPPAHYSGLWFTANEAGWGLSLHHGRTHQLFGALYVYSASGTSEWYTLQSGRWATSTRWEGKVFRSSGPAWLAPSFDPARVAHTEVGTIVLDFTMLPGREDRASMTVTIGGTTVTKTITRIRL